MKMHAIGSWVVIAAVWLWTAPCARSAESQAVYPAVDLSRVSTRVDPYRESRPEPTDWRSRPFYIVQTDLSPAWLVHCAQNQIVFFHDLPRWGLGLPSAIAFEGAGGRAVVRANSASVRIDGGELNAPWLLLWFEGAKGWNQWDVPWLLVLQNRPRSIELSEQGLALSFAQQAGTIGSMPLFGYYKCPLPNSAWTRRPMWKDQGIRTWEWKQSLPSSIVEGARWWAGHIRKFPVYAHETFSIDPATDSVFVRTKFEYMESTDAWGTKPNTFAPIPPVLAIALRTNWKTLKFAERIHDPFVVSGFGPYLGVADRDGYEYAFDGILKYVHEKEVHSLPTSGPGKDALIRLRNWMSQRATGQQYWPPFGLGNMVWSSAGADFIIPKLLPYVDEATRQRAIQSFDPWIRNYLLADGFEAEGRTWRFWLKQEVGNKTYSYVNGPGIGGDVYGDGGKLANNVMYTFWCYGHYMDRWEVLRANWDKIRGALLTPLSMDWKSLGRYAIAELGDECQPVMAAARTAYRLGDVDTYAYASYIFARQAVHHYVKSVGGQYFKENHPFNRTASPPADPYPLYLTNLLGHVVGWDEGGPNFGSTQWTNRFVRFNDEDMGRMHREQFGEFQKWELDHLADLWSRFQQSGHTISYDTTNDRSHINPSIPRLRGFLLDEPVEALVKLAPPSAIRQDSGYPMSMFAYVRASVPRQYERLVPPSGSATPFVLGKERDPGTFSPFLVQMGRLTKYWPVPSWYGGEPWEKDLGWKSPQRYLNYGTGNDYPFGAILPGLGTYPRRAAVNRLNWNTQVMSWLISTEAPVNLASEKRGTVARVSEMENNFYQPRRLIDGDLSGGWSSRRNVRGERWIEVEFRDVETVAVLSIHGGRAIKHIEASTDGREYRIVQPRPYEQRTEIRFEPPIRAKVLRITFADTDWVGVDEVEAFGPDTD